MHHVHSLRAVAAGLDDPCPSARHKSLRSHDSPRQPDVPMTLTTIRYTSSLLGLSRARYALE